jgi:uncharacterized protein YggE
MHIGSAISLLLSFVLCSAASVAQAGDVALKDSVPHITVMGSADMDVAPDLAILSLGVATERPAAAEALNENAKSVQKVIDDIKAQGLDQRDIKTTSVSLSPVYDSVTDPVSHATTQKLRGYSARNTIEIRFHDFSKAGQLASQWVGKGANEIEGLRFEVEHPAQAMQKLRSEAMRDALRQAQAYLPTEAGVKLGRIIEITAGDIPEPVRPGAMFREVRMAPGAAAPIPVEPGVQNLRSTVRVTWELVQ